jgi:parvulin-like peptidyl-prolyl isomerase
LKLQRNKKIFSAGLLITALLSFILSGSVFKETPDVLARVDKKKITKQALFRKTALYGITLSSHEQAESFLNGMINDMLILNMAQKDKIKIKREELYEEIENFVPGFSEKDIKKVLKKGGISYGYWLKDIKEKLIIRKEIEYVLKDKLEITDRELKDYYWTNILEFRQSRRVKARQIVTGSLEKAQEVLLKINNKQPFEELAKNYSITSEAHEGGDLGFIKQGEVPSFMNKIFTMKKGEISYILKSPYGYHIFKCEDIREAVTPGYDEVREDVKKKFREIKKDAAFSVWMKELRQKSDIKLYLEHLNMAIEEVLHAEN